MKLQFIFEAQLSVMKKTLNLILILPFTLMIFNSCSNAKSIAKDKETVKISKLNKEYEVKVGTHLTYTGSVHGSVGNQFELTVENDDVISVENTEFVYNDKSKSHMSGGDGGKRTYFMKAKQIGESNIIIEESFRGQIEATFKVKIKVVE